MPLDRNQIARRGGRGSPIRYTEEEADIARALGPVITIGSRGIITRVIRFRAPLRRLTRVDLEPGRIDRKSLNGHQSKRRNNGHAQREKTDLRRVRPIP